MMSELFDFATEHLVPDEHAKELTGPLWSDLSDVWVRAWREFLAIPEEQRARLMETPYVPPITIFGFAQSFAKEIFSNRESEGIIVCPELHVFGFYVHDKILVRFNALGSDFVVHNIQSGSDRKELYFRQEPLFGINNSATRLTVGSVANPTKTDLESVVISCQLGDSLYYHFRIDDQGNSTLAAPAATTPPQPKGFTSQGQAKRKPR